MVTCRVPSVWLTDFSACLYDWQTLIGACLALAGAWLTVRKIREQIVESKRQRDDEISRRHRAARTTLPLTLAAVSDITTEIVDCACQVRERYTADGSALTIDSILDESSISAGFAPVKLAPNTLSSFEKFVETLDNPSDIKHVHELVASLQVLLSRYNSFDLRGAGVVSGLEGLVLASARVKLLVDAMFSYAREPNARDFSLMGNSRQILWDELHKSAQSIVFKRPSPDLYFGRFAQVIENAKASDKSPWVEAGII